NKTLDTIRPPKRPRATVPHMMSSSPDNLWRGFQGGVARAKSFVKLLNVRAGLLLLLMGCAHLDDDLPLEPLARAAERDAALARGRDAQALRQIAAAARAGKRELLALVRARFQL